MYVNVHARLTSRLPDIHADVVSIGRVLSLNQPLRLIEQRENRRLLLCTHVKEIRYMALWNDKNMSSAKRVAVVADVGKRVLGNHVIRRA